MGMQQGNSNNQLKLSYKWRTAIKFKSIITLNSSFHILFERPALKCGSWTKSLTPSSERTR